MSTYRLKNLLAPRSLALVGASPRQGSVGGAVLRNIRNAKFKGEFGLVNYALCRNRWRCHGRQPEPITVRA